MRFLARLGLCSSILFLLATQSFAGNDIVVADFEIDGYGSWRAEGTAFGDKPAEGTLPQQMAVTGQKGKRLVNSFHAGDASTGTLTSSELTLSRRYVALLIGGGKNGNEVGIELLVNDKGVLTATGRDSERLDWMVWDVGPFQNQKARLRIFDRAIGGWGHILVDHIMLTDNPPPVVVPRRLEEYRKSVDYYREPSRPQFHFSPEMNWINDPNGLVYVDGEYHLFYQHNPHGNEWGHMSWGHAVSRDLLHWQHLPIALHDEYGVMIFSGSAVADLKNTSGFGTADMPPLVAIYTGHGYGKQTQDLAFSIDRGRTWTKYSNNPVLDLGEQDFRDPKVFWHDPTQRWVMVVSLAAKKIIQFYASPDLKSWTLLSEFGPAGVANKPNWECPDLFELPVENETGTTRWVLHAGMGSGSVAGSSGGEYFTGTFDGTRFVADSQESQWADYGRDFYAAVTWSNTPPRDGRRLWIGWMNNWETATNPTEPWRGAMSIPRELSLRRVDGKLRMCQQPVRELQSLRTRTLEFTNLTLDGESRKFDLHGRQLEIELEFDPGTAAEVGLRVLKGAKEQTIVSYDAKAHSVSIDRAKSGNVAYHPAFAGRHSAPLRPNAAGKVRLQVLVDACSVEVFGNDGEIAITDLVFPKPGSDEVELFCSGGRCAIASMKISQLSSVWR